jgi:predicted Zn-dependent protease
MVDMKSAFYDARGQRQKLDEKETKLVHDVLRAIASNDVNLDTIIKVASGTYKVVLEEIN